MSALVLAVLTPAFHYHQFGEATRMARDAGLSALFTCGSVIAVFGTIRAFRREIESGTMEMALAYPISRTGFLLAKAAGAFVAYLGFAAIVLSTVLVIVDGAAVGGVIAKRTGDIARLWGPCLAVGVAVLVLPPIVAAALNRFGRFRFVLSAFGVALALSALAAVLAIIHNGGVVLRLFPAVVAIACLTLVLLAASAAFAVRLKVNAAVSAVGLVFALLIPAVGNYYLSDALANGGVVSWGYVGLVALVSLPPVLLFLLLGAHFINGRDIT